MASLRNTTYGRAFAGTSPAPKLPAIDNLPAQQTSPTFHHVTSSSVIGSKLPEYKDVYGSSPYVRGRKNVDHAIGIPREAWM